MREIALHILDIVQNSIAAGASRIEVASNADTKNDILSISIKDDGRGMSPEMVKTALDPFCTTRTTRKVGLGLPMLAESAKACGGNVILSSKPGEGTQVLATFKLSHIDRTPYGDITSTMMSIIVANPEISIRYEQIVNGELFYLDTVDVRRELGEIPIQSAPVLKWLKDYFTEGIARVGEIP